MEKLWIRMGDNDDYNEESSPYDAGVQVSSLIWDENKPEASDIVWRDRYGVDVHPVFSDCNYISLFWGDDDAQPIRQLSKEEKAAFTQGLLEGD